MRRLLVFIGFAEKLNKKLFVFSLLNWFDITNGQRKIWKIREEVRGKREEGRGKREERREKWEVGSGKWEEFLVTPSYS